MNSLITVDQESLKSIKDAWITSSNILCEAILRIFPDAVPVSGGLLDSGFFYDFHNLSLSSSDFKAIEEEMSFISRKLNARYLDISDPKNQFSYLESNEINANKFRTHILENERNIFLYTNNDFKDISLNAPSKTERAEFVKILGTSSLYWMGDNKNESLTRITGVSFSSPKSLKEHLNFLEEVKKRDHREIGRQQSIFMFSDLAPGFPLILPNGMKIMNALSRFWKSIHDDFKYQEIKTPAICSNALWKMSGHAEHYSDNMFHIGCNCSSNNNDEGMSLKAMNCPGAMLYFKSLQVSYKDLPLKLSEKGSVFRNEFSGALSGLCRVRNFHQDDAHIFVDLSHIHDEINSILNMIDSIYKTLKLNYHVEIATKPEDSCGTDEEWESATKALIDVVKQRNMEFKINEGDGAFYGPKIDIYIKDAIGRTWQCGTIQLDFSAGERFNLHFTNENNEKEKPIVIHRAIFGSFERFLAILLEHFEGKMPLWLSPKQIAVIHIPGTKRTMVSSLEEDLKKVNCHIDFIEKNISLGKKMRECIKEKYNYIITIGSQEEENNTLSVRKRGEKSSESISYEDFIKKIAVEISSMATS